MPKEPGKPTRTDDPRLVPIQARGHMPPKLPRDAVADELRDRIKRGVYAPGSMLPSIPELVSITTGAAKNTINDAVKILEREGYVKVLQGIGTYVLTEEFWGEGPV